MGVITYKKINRSLIVRIYFVIMFFSTIYTCIISFNIIVENIKSLNVYTCIIMTFISIIVYIVDFAVLNIVENNALILDLKYYFKGNVDNIKFFISCLFVVMEEIVFRAILVGVEEKKYIYLFVSSICFGIIHIFFSKYDCFSKIALGIFLGVICIITRNLIYSIMVHTIYNYLALKIIDAGMGGEYGKKYSN